MAMTFMAEVLEEDTEDTEVTVVAMGVIRDMDMEVFAVVFSEKKMK